MSLNIISNSIKKVAKTILIYSIFLLYLLLQMQTNFDNHGLTDLVLSTVILNPIDYALFYVS